MTHPTPPRRTSNSADRALRVLVLVAGNRRPQRFADIQRGSGIPKGTLHALLASLEGAGFLERGRDGTYAIGLTAFEVGTSFATHTGVREATGPVLDALRDRFNETIHFGALRGGEVVYLERRDCTHEVRYAAGLGERKPAYGTALGKAMLAAIDRDEVVALYPERLPPITARTIPTRDALLHQLDVIAARGYATEDEESTTGVRCVGVPIRLRDTVHGLSVTVPVQRATLDRLVDLVPALTEAATDIRARLRALDWVQGPTAGDGA